MRGHPRHSCVLAHSLGSGSAQAQPRLSPGLGPPHKSDSYKRAQLEESCASILTCIEPLRCTRPSMLDRSQPSKSKSYCQVQCFAFGTLTEPSAIKSMRVMAITNNLTCEDPDTALRKHSWTTYIVVVPRAYWRSSRSLLYYADIDSKHPVPLPEKGEDRFTYLCS